MGRSMIDRGKQNLLGVMVDSVDYEYVVDQILEAARAGRPFSCTALAVHGVMSGVLDAQHRYRLNSLDVVTPDGQPVRWALNWLFGVQLKDRVYGPKLMIETCTRASEEGLRIYLYGAQPDVVARLSQALQEALPGLEVAGAEPSRFGQLSADERSAMIGRIRDSGAAITFVGLGCPRQETFIYECATDLSMPVVAVGAAFDYHSGVKSEPPAQLQRLGLQWAYRLAQDPRRLWKRYLGLNTLYVALFLLQFLRIWRPRMTTEAPTRQLRHG